VSGAQVLIGSQVISVPRNAPELRALRARRSELSNQLTNVADRRGELLEELERAEGAARPGLEQRIQLLDQRILELETALQRTGELVVAAPAEVYAGPSPRDAAGRSAFDESELAMAFIFAVLMPLALAFVWRAVRRGRVPASRPTPPEDAERLARLEQAIDTIAVEVERISEGQRFVTQLLADGRETRQLEGVRTDR
jgi:hypothetical protein